MRLLLADTVSRCVVSMDVGSGAMDYALECSSGHRPWQSLPYTTRGVAASAACEVCQALDEGDLRLLRRRVG